MWSSPRPPAPTRASCSRSLGLTDFFGASSAFETAGAAANAVAKAAHNDCSRKSRRVWFDMTNSPSARAMRIELCRLGIYEDPLLDVAFRGNDERSPIFTGQKRVDL